MAFELNTGTAASALSGGEKVPVSQSSNARAATVDQFKAYIFGTIVAEDRAALAALTPSAGDMAWLTETGRVGTFKFDAGNLAAKITADPYQGIFVAPDSDDTGASGAWVRQFPIGVAMLDWFGAAGDGVDSGGGIWTGTPDTERFISALALAEVKVLLLGPKAYIVNKATSGTIIDVNGKTIRGCGPDVTRICKGPGSGTQSAPVEIFRPTNGAHLCDFTVEGNKSGLGGGATQRVHFTRTQGSGVLVERIWARNLTGYCFYAEQQSGGPATNFVYRDCRSWNCEVHIEPTWATDFLYENIICDTGDNDIVQIGMEGYGVCDRGTFRRVRMTGAMTGFNLALNFNDMEDLTFDTCTTELSTNYISLIVSNGSGVRYLTGLRTNNCHFNSLAGTEGLGLLLDCVKGAKFTNSTFEGSVGVSIAADCEVVQAVNCLARGDLFPAVMVTAGATGCTWDGELDGVGSGFSGNLEVSATTVSSPPLAGIDYMGLAKTITAGTNVTVTAMSGGFWNKIEKTGGTDNNQDGFVSSGTTAVDFYLEYIVSTLDTIAIGVAETPSGVSADTQLEAHIYVTDMQAFAYFNGSIAKVMDAVHIGQKLIMVRRAGVIYWFQGEDALTAWRPSWEEADTRTVGLAAAIWGKDKPFAGRFSEIY